MANEPDKRMAGDRAQLSVPLAKVLDACADASAFKDAEAEIRRRREALDEYIDLSVDHGNLHTWHTGARFFRDDASLPNRESMSGRSSVRASALALGFAASPTFWVATAAVLLLSLGSVLHLSGDRQARSDQAANERGLFEPRKMATEGEDAKTVATRQPLKWNRPAPVFLAEQSVGGDLSVRLQRNFDRLESEQYRPQSGALRNIGTARSWPGDFAGRTALALTLLTQATSREALYLDEIIDGFPAGMNSRGYFGPILPSGSVDEQQLSSHGWVLRALCEHYRWKSDERSLALIHRIVENLVMPAAEMVEDYPIKPSERQKLGRLAATWKPAEPGWRLSRDDGCVFIFMDGVVQALGVDPTPELQSAAERFINLFCDTDLEVIKAQTHASLTGMRAALAYYEVTGDKRVLDNVRDKFSRYKARAMTETYENYNWFGRPSFTEPCGVIDSYLVATELWRLVGDPVYLEDAHHIYFNGFAATQRPNGGFGQNCCVGPDQAFLSVRTDEAHWCCTMRGAEGLVRAAQSAYFTTDESMLVANYATNEGRLRVGDSILDVAQQSRYPFAGESRLEITSVSQPREIDVRFFAPTFSRDLVVMLNGQVVPTVTDRGFAKITMTPSEGDVIEVIFDLDSGWSEPINNRVADGKGTVKYGPLLLASVGGGQASLSRRNLHIRNTGGGAFVADNEVVLHALYSVAGPQVPQEVGRMRILFDREETGR